MRYDLQPRNIVLSMSKWQLWDVEEWSERCGIRKYGSTAEGIDTVGRIDIEILYAKNSTTNSFVNHLFNYTFIIKNKGFYQGYNDILKF